MALSFDPSDAEERAFDSRERVFVKDAYTELTDYGGRVDPPVPVLTLELQSKSGFRKKRSYSAGGAGYVVPNADGTGFDPVGESRGLPSSCNAVAFLQSLVAAGFPAKELANGDITTLVGLELVLIEVDQPQRFASKPKPKLGPDGQPVKDAQGKPVMLPAEPPKKFWLVSEIGGIEQPTLPGVSGGKPHATTTIQPPPTEREQPGVLADYHRGARDGAPLDTPMNTPSAPAAPAVPTPTGKPDLPF